MDENRYGELLKDIRPRIIETAEEHERLLTVAENLMEKGDALSPEEREALALVVLLIEAFEANVLQEDDSGNDDQDSEESANPAEPHIALHRLMQRHQLELDDIAPVFGN